MHNVSKQYVYDSLFVVEIDLPRITYRLQKFNTISITLRKLKTFGPQYETYVYESNALIYEELKDQYFPPPPPPTVYVEQKKIIIKIKTRFKLEWYRWGVVSIEFRNRFSGQYTHLVSADLSKRYVRDGMLVVEVDKLIVAREVVGFDLIEVILNSGELERYTYESDHVVYLTEELTD
jgi:hypothetical protein